MKLCSACLLGIKCRYDGKSKPHKKIIELSTKEQLIPVCPEELGGESTPREPREIKNGKVFTKSGVDVTENMKNGALKTLALTKKFDIKSAILKSKSPSCGCGKIYDGNFSDTLIDGDGITTKILKENGIEILTENDL